MKTRSTNVCALSCHWKNECKIWFKAVDHNIMMKWNYSYNILLLILYSRTGNMDLCHTMCLSGTNTEPTVLTPTMSSAQLFHWGHLSLSWKVVSLEVQQQCSWLNQNPFRHMPSLRSVIQWAAMSIPPAKAPGRHGTQKTFNSHHMNICFSHNNELSLLFTFSKENVSGVC